MANVTKDDTDEMDNKRTNIIANKAVTEDFHNYVQLANTKVR